MWTHCFYAWGSLPDGKVGKESLAERMADLVTWKQKKRKGPGSHSPLRGRPAVI